MYGEDMRRFESVLAFHAAPTLMGLKCGSLPALCVQEYDLEGAEELFDGGYFGERIGARFISRCRQRRLIYVYDKPLLERTLRDREVRAFLQRYGYCLSWGTEQCLDRLCGRLCEKDFPHEIGIFLGYPLEDVRGFIANCGQHCKYCGVWKVYGDVERAKELFRCYRDCRVKLCRELEKGKMLRSCVAHATKIA